MLVKCPKCNTTYKVADEVVSGSSPAFRCSRCKHTFELDPTREEKLPQEMATSDPATTDSELSFTFDKSPQATGASHEAKLGEAQSPEDVSTKDPASAGRDSLAEKVKAAWAMDDQSGDRKSQPETELPYTISANEHDQELRRSLDKIVDPMPELSSEEAPITFNADHALGLDMVPPPSEHQVSLKPFITLFCLLVVGFGFFTAIGYINPVIAKGFLRHVPIVGASVLQNTHLKEGIVLRALSGEYQNIQGSGEVFVVSGEAVNQNPTVIREIQLTGKLFGNGGETIEQQTIWVGNTLSRKILRGMSRQDIPHLQNLKPLKSFEIPPGDAVPFTIVFLKPAKNAKDFTCEIIAVSDEV